MTLHGRTLLGAVLVLACAGAVGSGGSALVDARRTGSFGQGADRFWIFSRPDEDPRAASSFSTDTSGRSR